MKALRVAVAAVAAWLWLVPDAAGQQFLWNADFDFRFDNREYDAMATARSETIFGVRLTPEVGLGWGRGNAVMVGLDLFSDFGTTTDISRQMIVYYRYRDDRFDVHFGRFPRRHLMGDYEKAFFSDWIDFYDSNIDGLMANWRGRHGYVELAFDWNGKIGAGQREKFMIFSSGRLNYGAFYGGYNANMYHYSCSLEEPGVVDNILIYPFAGADFRTVLPAFSKLFLQVGWLQSFQRDRLYVGRFVNPGGMQIELGIERWGFGIDNTLYLGSGLMPYYGSVVEGQPAYGAELYPGELFYRTTAGVYNRLEIYWRYCFPSGVAFKVASVHHYDGHGWGWQQRIELQVPLSDKMFRKHPRPKDETARPAADRSRAKAARRAE